VVDNVNTSPALYYVHTDHLGRPARMTAPNQSWAWDVIYDPFGNVSYSWSNPEVMNIRFPGQWFQLETGLAYNWHRHYDATLGRYVQPDPLGLRSLMSDGPSAYGYVGGNPLAYSDPRGEFLQLPILAWAALGVYYSVGSQITLNQLNGLDHEQAVLCVNLVQVGVDSTAWGLTGIVGATFDVGVNIWRSGLQGSNFAPLGRALPGWASGAAAQKAAPYFSYTIADLIGEKCKCTKK
jgi:RHS repeat-associated protein